MSFQDVTGLYTALDIVGPASRNLMQDLTKQSMTSSDFPTFANKVLHIFYLSLSNRLILINCDGSAGTPFQVR